MMAGVDLVHVPYRGTAPLLADLISGQMQVTFDNVSTSIEYIRSGKLRALAVTSEARSELLPEIPTIGEFLRGYDASALDGTCRRPIEKSPLAPIEMSLSPVFESDGELAADDGDLDEPFGDRSDERSARSGGGSDQGFRGSDPDGTRPSSGVSVGEGVSAARLRCPCIAPTRETEQPILSVEFADRSGWHHP